MWIEFLRTNPEAYDAFLAALTSRRLVVLERVVSADSEEFFRIQGAVHELNDFLHVVTSKEREARDAGERNKHFGPVRHTRSA